MAGQNSYKQSIPLEEKLQSTIQSFSSMSFFYQMKNKIVGKKHNRKGEDSCDNLMTLILKKYDHLSNSVHSFLFKKSIHKSCSCAGFHSKCLFDTDADPHDLYHACGNSHTNVPSCCVEPYIINGYVLAHQPFRYYLKILWTPTNETLNVWTHLVPSFYFMFLLYTFNQTIDLRHAWPLFILTFSAIALTICSAIAHLFHSRSSFHHCCWFILDYFGITLYAFSSVTAHFFASSELSYYNRIGCFNLPIFVVIGIIGFFCCCYAKTAIDGSTRHRRLKIASNALGYLYGMIPIGHRLITSEGEDPNMYFHQLQFFFMLLSPITYALDIPQKFLPGKFDIIGHSHQLFHIFCALGCYYDIMAIHHDIQSERWTLLTNQSHYPHFEAVCVAAAILVFMCGVLACRFMNGFKICFKEELDGMSGDNVTEVPLAEKKQQ